MIFCLPLEEYSRGILSDCHLHQESKLRGHNKKQVTQEVTTYRKDSLSYISNKSPLLCGNIETHTTCFIINHEEGLQSLVSSTLKEDGEGRLEEEEEEELIEANSLHHNAEQKVKELTVANHRDPLSPDEIDGIISLVAALKTCTEQNDLQRGSKLHADIVREGLLQRDIYVGNCLLNLYAKCNRLAKAQQVFDEIPAPNVVSWNGLIAGYARHGHNEEALHCYQQMQVEGCSPSAVTFLSLIKACVRKGAIEMGQQIHAEVVEKVSLTRERAVGNALVDMYAKFGLLAKAQEVFNKLSSRDVVSWNSVMGGYAQHEHGKEALECFEQMLQEGISPEAITFVCLFNACGCIGALDKGQELHARIIHKGLLERNRLAATALIDMYAKCGLLDIAREVFDKLGTPLVGSWNALIAGYIQHEHHEEALSCFDRMQLDGFIPNEITFLSILKLCGSTGAAKMGQVLHVEISRRGLLENDVGIVNALIDMYAKCGLLVRAKEAFDRLRTRNIISWNALITGYSQYMHDKAALGCLEKMQADGFSPDAVTFVCSLKACGSIEAPCKGQELHADIVRKGLSERETIVGNALIDMYANCGLIMEAQDVFERSVLWDVVSWNTLIAGLTKYDCGEDALNYYDRMQGEGFCPNGITFISVLKACCTIGAASKGQDMHDRMVKDGHLDGDVIVGTALVDMYANCGLLQEAKDLFEEQPIQDVVLWNALIAGYSQLGEYQMVFDLFERMNREGTQPDFVTFTTIFNTCIHAGLLDEGKLYFEIMRTAYEIAPTLEHYTSMIDLFARAGQLGAAVAIVKGMPSHADGRVLHIILGACQNCGDEKLGRLAFEFAEDLNGTDAASYVYLSNIWAVRHLSEDMGVDVK